MISVSQIVQRIAALETTRTAILVAIDGRGGSGKTTLASSLATNLKAMGRRVVVIHFDDFYLPSVRRPGGIGAEKPAGGDFDWQRLRDELLVPLRNGRSAVYARYDWVEDALAEAHVVFPDAIVIIEGVSTCRRELAAMYDLRIWVDCPQPLRLSRGIARDGEGNRAQWELDWMPSEDRYVREHRPDAVADVIFNGVSSL